jgi:CheY-like chemotaxis protein
MPGFDGGDVSAALYRDDDTRHIPVLFLSALVASHAQVGGRHVVSKSAPVAELIARIDALLDL